MSPRRIGGPPGPASLLFGTTERREPPRARGELRVVSAPGRHYVAGGSDTRRRGRTVPQLGVQGAPVVPRGVAILKPHDLDAIYARIEALRADPRVTVDDLGAAHGHPLHGIRLTDPGPGPKLKVLITAGVHGNEPCGPGAAMLMLEQLLAEPRRLEGLDVTLIPVINPRGLRARTRRTPEDVDINRVCGQADAPVEAQLTVAYLKGKRHDLALDLHSGAEKRNGFWVLHRNAEDLLGPAMKKLGARWPLLSGDTKPYKMSSPGVGTSKNRSTLKDFIFDQGTPRTATLEAPGSLDYLQQVLGQNAMLHDIIGELQRVAEQGGHAGVA